MNTTTSLPLIKKGDRPLLHFGLFVLTLVSVFISFLSGMGGGVASDDLKERVTGAGLFALSTLLILMSHELGHFILARHHGVDSSLPWFIPLPLVTPFGTLGAVIRLKGRVPHKNALVDIGAAGPLAGLLIAIPLMVVGMALSRVGPSGPQPEVWLGDGSLFALVRELYRWATHSQGPAPALGVMVFGDNLLVLGLQLLIKGPLKDGTAVYAHPVFISAWFGTLVTMLNLIPVGQLDGGHLTHAWFGERAVAVGKLMSLGMLVLGITASASWLVWLLVTAKLVGYGHPPVVTPEEPLSPGRKLVCAVCFVFLALCLIPAPVQLGAAS
jgi:membrane-associated protease RseP (regulator of RpoE activity)